MYQNHLMNSRLCSAAANCLLSEIKIVCLRQYHSSYCSRVVVGWFLFLVYSNMTTILKVVMEDECFGTQSQLNYSTRRTTLSVTIISIFNIFCERNYNNETSISKKVYNLWKIIHIKSRTHIMPAWWIMENEISAEGDTSWSN